MTQERIAMNFLDAHKIVHDFGTAVGRGVPDEHCFLFRPISYIPFKFDKDLVTQAFMIFYAHMFFYNTRTQEEFQAYESVRRTINYFVSDEKLDEIRYTVKLATSPSLLDKVLKKTDIEYARNRLSTLLKSDDDLYNYRGEDVENYCHKMLSLHEKVQLRIASPDYQRKEFYEFAYCYCKSAYDEANIEFHEDYCDYFFPFDFLREYIKQPQWAEYFKDYLEYIQQNK